VNSGLTPFILFSAFFYSQAFKATTHTTMDALHVPKPMASTHPKSKSTVDPSSPSPMSPTVTNALKEENKGIDGPCETIKMATKEEKDLVIVLLVYCGDHSESTNVGTVDQSLDEEGVYHFNCLIDGKRIVTADARAMLEDAVVILFLKDASAKKGGANTSSSSMEVSAASSLANEEVDVHDMRVPATKLSKNAPQLDKGKLTWK
jgi:hypothetical protein